MRDYENPKRWKFYQNCNKNLSLLGTTYEKYLTDDIYPDEPPIEDSPTDISREDDIDDASTYIDDGNRCYFEIIFWNMVQML